MNCIYTTPYHFVVNMIFDKLQKLFFGQAEQRWVLILNYPNLAFLETLFLNILNKHFCVNISYILSFGSFARLVAKWQQMHIVLTMQITICEINMRFRENNWERKVQPGL